MRVAVAADRADGDPVLQLVVDLQRLALAILVIGCVRHVVGEVVLQRTAVIVRVVGRHHVREAARVVLVQRDLGQHRQAVVGLPLQTQADVALVEVSGMNEGVAGPVLVLHVARLPEEGVRLSKLTATRPAKVLEIRSTAPVMEMSL